MATSISSSLLGGVGANATDPYARVNKALLSQNASLQKLSATIGSDQAKLSALGKLSSSLFEFQKVAQSLDGGGLNTGASSSNPKVLSAFTNGNAKPGTASIEVKQLAQAQVQASKSLSSAQAAVGSGTLTLTSQDKTTSITIDESNNSLDGIAKALQAAGFDAKVVKGSKGFSLELTAGSGVANTISVAAKGDAALNAILDFDQTKAAQQAVLTVNGKEVRSDSNTVTGAISGVALALTGTGKSTLSVAQDTAQISKNIGNFVTAYNSLNARLREFGEGQLKADSALQQVSTGFRQLAASPGLARIGINVAGNGDLKVDNAKLQAAISADASGVGRLFIDKGTGVAERFADTVDKFLGSGGAIAREQASVSREISKLTDKKEQLSKALSLQAQVQAAQYAGQSGNLTGTSSLFDFLA